MKDTYYKPHTDANSAEFLCVTKCEANSLVFLNGMVKINEIFDNGL